MTGQGSVIPAPPPSQFSIKMFFFLLLLVLAGSGEAHWVGPGSLQQPPTYHKTAGEPLVLGGSLCSEYLALQSEEEEEECETVMEEKCFTQNSTQCLTQYVKVTSSFKKTPS